MDYNLERFISAQRPVIATVRAELKAGAKRSHWMWYVFPQIAGLGHSAMSQTYAISNLAEARAYLANAVLGPCLLDCTSLVLGVEDRSAKEIFGAIDAAKFRSCMTLFAQASDNPIFHAALAKYFNGENDPETLARLQA